MHTLLDVADVEKWRANRNSWCNRKKKGKYVRVQHVTPKPNIILHSSNFLSSASVNPPDSQGYRDGLNTLFWLCLHAMKGSSDLDYTIASLLLASGLTLPPVAPGLRNHINHKVQRELVQTVLTLNIPPTPTTGHQTAVEIDRRNFKLPTSLSDLCSTKVCRGPFNSFSSVGAGPFCFPRSHFLVFAPYRLFSPLYCFNTLWPPRISPVSCPLHLPTLSCPPWHLCPMARPHSSSHPSPARGAEGSLCMHSLGDINPPSPRSHQTKEALTNR